MPASKREDSRRAAATIRQLPAPQQHILNRISGVALLVQAPPSHQYQHWSQLIDAVIE
jgi:hypothetical protein